VLSPHPCVYRARAIKALEDRGIKWQLVFSSPSYNSTIAAVKAGLGISILPRIMVPKDLKIIDIEKLPKLEDTHISLLKHTKDNASINSFESFVFKKLI
jgi:DNA-binding transcriptional LysR family regulator